MDSLECLDRKVQKVLKAQVDKLVSLDCQEQLVTEASLDCQAKRVLLESQLNKDKKVMPVCQVCQD